MNIWYAPEENINFTNYLNLYYDILTDRPINLAALHGGFDKVMPDFLVEEVQGNAVSTSLIFMYDDLETLVHGPLVAGHWHTGDTYKHLQYVGSFDRYSFAEEDPKGFCIYEYDTDTLQYRSVKLNNFLAPIFKTYEIYTSQYKGVEEYHALMEAVDANLKADPAMQIRLLIRVDAEQVDMEQQIENLKFYYANQRRVKFTLINKLHKDEKKKKKETKEQLDQAYSFVYDKNMNVAAKIQKFMEVSFGKVYPLDLIKSVIQKYLENAQI